MERFWELITTRLVSPVWTLEALGNSALSLQTVPFSHLKACLKETVLPHNHLLWGCTICKERHPSLSWQMRLEKRQIPQLQNSATHKKRTCTSTEPSVGLAAVRCGGAPLSRGTINPMKHSSAHYPKTRNNCSLTKTSARQTHHVAAAQNTAVPLVKYYFLRHWSSMCEYRSHRPQALKLSATLRCLEVNDPIQLTAQTLCASTLMVTTDLHPRKIRRGRAYILYFNLHLWENI